MAKVYKVMFSVSLILMAISLALFLIYGLNLGIDFTGGSFLEVEFLKERPQIGTIKKTFSDLNIGQVLVSEAGERGLILKMAEVSEEMHQKILAELKNLGELEEKRFDSIGSVLGSELKRKSVIAIVIALFFISLYLAIAFYKIGGTIRPWILALGAIIALIHDLLLPMGLFVWLGQFKDVTIDASIIAAALTILGYSVNDTVVIYDRIRENIVKKASQDFNTIVHESIKQTISRSINTGLAAILMMIAIYFLGGESLKNFSLALIIGIASGAYSSIFVASPILMMLHRKQQRPS
ncbi:MAG: protein translocase subunit SecF [Patescibacteria group bacterium]